MAIKLTSKRVCALECNIKGKVPDKVLFWPTASFGGLSDTLRQTLPIRSNIVDIRHNVTVIKLLTVTIIYSVSYSWKSWQGIKFGGLVVCLSNHQVKICQNFLLTYIRMAIPY